MPRRVLISILFACVLVGAAMLWRGSWDAGHPGVNEGAATRNAIPDSGSQLEKTNSQAGVPILADTIDEPDVPTTKPATGRVTGKAVDIQGHGPVADFTVYLFRGDRILRSNAAEVIVMFQGESGNFEVTDLEHTHKWTCSPVRMAINRSSFVVSR